MRCRPIAAAAACLLPALALLALGCSDRPRVEGRAARFNLILISIDTLRADRLGSYGYPRPTSPAIDRFAGRGVRFARAFAESSWTLPSHMTLMTGLAPSTHGVTTRQAKLNEQIPVLAELLRNAGYRTYGLTAGGMLAAAFGFARGFEEYVAAERKPLREVLSLARERIAGFDPQTRYFLFLHTYDVHAPYNPPERYVQMFQTRRMDDSASIKLREARVGHTNLTPGQFRFLSDQYDAGIRAVDEQLGDFFTWLDDRRVFDDTIVIVLSDHGEELGEHGANGHGFSLYVQTLHIPLIVVAPGIAPRVVQHATGLADVLPTALALLGLQAPAVEGQSLLPMMQRTSGDDAERPLFSELSSKKIMRSVLRGRYHLIADVTRAGIEPQLFDLQKDPAERRPLAHHDQEPELEQMLVAHASLKPQQGPSKARIEPALAERLRALGYGDDEPVRVEESPPADLIAPARAGDPAAVAKLLDGGADVNARGATGETALIAAATLGHDDVVALLLSRGAEVDAVDDRDTTALIAAVEEGHEQTVQLLLAHGALLNGRAKADGRGHAPLIVAAATRRTVIMRLLLDTGADRNVTDSKGMTALHHAARDGLADEVSLLLSSGADPNVRDSLGMTPLIAAAAANAPEVVKALVAAGASVNAKRPDGSTALLAASDEDAEEIVEFLLEHGADVHANVEGGTALHTAIENEDVKLVKLLLDYGADPEARNEQDESAIEIGADTDSPEIKQMLADAVQAKRARPGRHRGAAMLREPPPAYAPDLATENAR